MKIGIPRALLYYYYNPFWEPFFENLGLEVVISDETNKTLVNKGVKESVPEICVPIKIFIGHTINLLEKDVDYIFVPRMVSIRKGEVFCPKFMGLPDMMEHSVEGVAEKMLTCHIKTKGDDISDYRNYLEMGKKLGFSKQEIKDAAEKAGQQWHEFRKFNKLGYPLSEASRMVKKNVSLEEVKQDENRIKIGVIGYVYNIYDNFISMDIINRLKELNVDFVTFDMMEEEELEASIADMDKTLFWTFSNKLMGAGYKLFRNQMVDGLIHITAFGCGPDSFLGKLFEIESDEQKVPFMTIRIDEHTGENHLQTRIEAFIDMLKRKKLKAM